MGLHLIPLAPRYNDRSPQVIRTLHIEDSRELAAAVRVICRRTCEIDTVETLAEAQQHLRFRAYDILLVDLNLPDSMGLDTIKALISHGVPIVVLTGDPTEAFVDEAVELGVADYLSKGDGALSKLALRLQFVHGRVAKAAAMKNRKSLTFNGFAALKPYLSCAALA